MTSDFKVVLRDYFNSDSTCLRWEEGCPVVPAAVQVSRNRGTSEEHLQLRFRNISSKIVNEFTWEASISFADGTVQELRETHLDADIRPGAVFDVNPIVLENVKTTSVEVRIVAVESGRKHWTAEGQLTSLLPRATLGWDEELLAQRYAYLCKGKGLDAKGSQVRWTCSCGGSGVGMQSCYACGKQSPLAAALLDGKVQERECYWLCACGEPNVERDRCWSCEYLKDDLVESESIDRVRTFAAQRVAETQHRRKKAVTIGVSVVTALAVVGVVFFAIVNPIIQKNDAYQAARRHMAQSNYATAAALLEGLEWQDSEELYRMCSYEVGIRDEASDRPESALDAFRAAIPYKDAEARAEQLEIALAQTGEDAADDTGKGDGSAESTVENETSGTAEDSKEPKAKSAQGDAIETPYYSVDLSKIFSESEMSDVTYEYASGYAFQEPGVMGMGYGLRVWDGDRTLFYVGCFSEDWGPQGEYESMVVGRVESPDYGAMQVYLYVPYDINAVEGTDLARRAADELRAYMDGVSVKGGVSSEVDYILPESDSRKYARSELSSLSTWELYIARNEIFARYGRRFNNADLAEHFNSKSWYSETWSAEEFDEWFSPNEYEKANADLIMELERDAGSPYLS